MGEVTTKNHAKNGEKIEENLSGVLAELFITDLTMRFVLRLASFLFISSETLDYNRSKHALCEQGPVDDYSGELATVATPVMAIA